MIYLIINATAPFYLKGKEDEICQQKNGLQKI